MQSVVLGYRGFPHYTDFGTLKKPSYAKFALGSIHMWLLMFFGYFWPKVCFKKTVTYLVLYAYCLMNCESCIWLLFEYDKKKKSTPHEKYPERATNWISILYFYLLACHQEAPFPSPFWALIIMLEFLVLLTWYT